MRRLAAAVAAAAATLAACGTPGADLLVVHRSGSVPGARLTIRVVDDGQVVCNGRTHPLPSEQLIDARELVRDLARPAKAGRSLPAGHPSILRFRIRTEDGTVAFSDTSPNQPPAFYRAAQLVRAIAQRACGLPR